LKEEKSFALGKLRNVYQEKGKKELTKKKFEKK